MGDSATSGPSLRGALFIMLLGFVFALPGLFSLPPLDRDESRFAQASLQMLESGDFVRIKFQDDERNKKPVGVYWLQAASAGLFAPPPQRAIWAYRLPSAVAAALTALFTYLAGAWLLGRSAGLMGAALLAASVLMATEGMIAKTDAALSAAAAAALAALAALRTRGTDDRGRWASLGFWAAIGAGVLLKGPIAPMIAGLCVLGLGAWERRWSWAKPLGWPAGPILAALLVAPWLAAIGVATEGRFFAEAVGGDLGSKLAQGGSEGHGAPPGLHLLLSPFLAFPITLGLLPAARLAKQAIGANRTAPEAASARLLLAWILPAWLVFELTPTKLPHYPLPLYPAIALLAAAGLKQSFAAGRRLGPASLALFGLGGALLIGVCAFAATQLYGDEADGLRRATLTIVSLSVPALLALAALAFTRRTGLAVAIVCALSGMLLFTARERIAPEARRWFPAQEAVIALRRENLLPGPAGAPGLISVGLREPSLVFLTGSDTRLATAAEAARLARPGGAALIAADERAAFEQALAPLGLAFEPRGLAIRGFNYSKGDELQLQPGAIVPLKADDAANPTTPKD